ncbi:MAG: DUF2157 domain-containing protein [Parvibaculum sp.]|nr:DUF2157 domain-containing protein [Parvibaculum sp.]
MWQRAYLNRLKRDLDLWIERGWVTAANADAILASAAEPGASTRRMPAILAILGAVLIGFAVMSFVAANWQEISKLTKIVLIFAAMWTAYGAAIVLEKRGHANFAQAAVLIGLGLFGAGIMLIAQIYHIVADDPGGVLAWCVAALATAWLLPSRAALALGILLAVVWTWFAIDMNDAVPHWAFWFAWAAAAALALRLSWTPALHLVLIAGFLWQAINVEAIMGLTGLSPSQFAVFVALEALALWMAALAFARDGARLGSVAEAYGIVVAFALVGFFQVDPGEYDRAAEGAAGPTLIAATAILAAALAALAVMRGRLPSRHVAGVAALAALAIAYPFLSASENAALIPWIYAAAILVLAAWLVSWGSASGSRFAVNFGFVVFAAEVLWLYFATLGTLLDTAIFFALGGVLLIVGSIVFERMRRRIVRGTATEGGAA